MIEAALGMEATATLPEIKLTGGGQLDLLNVSVGCRREELARALLEYYAAQFGVLLEGVTNGQKPRRLFVGGGLSRSAPWLAFLQDRYGFPLTQTAGEHPGLVGIAKTIQRQSQR
jgi:sugar (pentulose or hexulose) kinase